jgi:hypothetical protein
VKRVKERVRKEEEGSRTRKGKREEGSFIDIFG